MIFLLTRYSIVLQKLLMKPRRKVNDGILQCNVLAGIVALIISDVNSAEWKLVVVTCIIGQGNLQKVIKHSSSTNETDLQGRLYSLGAEK